MFTRLLRIASESLGPSFLEIEVIIGFGLFQTIFRGVVGVVKLILVAGVVKLFFVEYPEPSVFTTLGGVGLRVFSEVGWKIWELLTGSLEPITTCLVAMSEHALVILINSSVLEATGCAKLAHGIVQLFERVSECTHML